jgi:hypothetical protein
MMSGKKTTETKDVILEDYTRSSGFFPKFWRKLLIILLFVFFIFLYKFGIVDRAVSKEELKSAVEICEVSSKWIVKRRVDSENFKGIILVPRITFQIKNHGDRELHHVFFLGVFRFVNTPNVLGEGSAWALKEPLMPGKKSKPIVLTSQFGYTAESEQAFLKNPGAWKMAYVEIFIRSLGSELVFLKSFYISKKIEGLDIDVKIL